MEQSPVVGVTVGLSMQSWPTLLIKTRTKKNNIKMCLFRRRPGSDIPVSI